MSQTRVKEKPSRAAVEAKVEKPKSTKFSQNGKNGRPEWEPARQLIRGGGVSGLETQDAAWERARNAVRMGAVAGTPHEVIARTIVSPACSVDTLYKYFRNELDDGKAQVAHAMVSRLVADGLRGNDRNQRFYLETQCGWKRQVDANLGELVIRTISGDEDL